MYVAAGLEPETSPRLTHQKFLLKRICPKDISSQAFSGTAETDACQIWTFFESADYYGTQVLLVVTLPSDTQTGCFLIGETALDINEVGCLLSRRVLRS